MIFPCILLAIIIIYIYHALINALNAHMIHINLNKVNTSDKNTDTVQKEPQKSINEASDWCDNNAMILHPAKQIVFYSILGKSISFACVDSSTRHFNISCLTEQN